MTEPGGAAGSHTLYAHSGERRKAKPPALGRRWPAVYNDRGVRVGSRDAPENKMPELQDARHLLDMAEHAAIDGDFSSADQLLKDAARIQEAELGPLHPDLANTLNNLAIVAERTGRPGDAETFYRRAAAIASASLPADHPMVAESRQNLEDFCREHGLQIAEATVMTPSAPDTMLAPEALAPEVATRAAERAAEPTASQPLPTAPRRSSRPLVWVAIAAIVLIAVGVLVSRPRSSREASTVSPAAAKANEPPQPPLVMPAPTEPAPPPKAVRPPSSAPSSGAVSLAAAQLCQTFSPSGGQWRCDPPSDPVARGPIVLYTRVKASRDATIVHRWYHDETLRQAVRLTIGANLSQGYRTYSRQIVADAGNWRVEVRSADGDLLHEERFAVR
jgi:Protein of unknown function (DUF2914)/Tetratricopeptide repeat